MIFKETELKGLFEITPELKEDERGDFTRIFAEDELKKIGVDFTILQANRSFSKSKNTVRGMHFQAHPFWEDKIMTCIEGSIYIIVVDLRPNSPTHKEWLSFELSQEKK